ncbi:MAG: hypothetical protein WAN65_18745 [Candidatus Sulfotelmatobacter sp.]
MDRLFQQLIELNLHCREILICQLKALIKTWERDVNHLIERDTTEETRKHLFHDIEDLDQLIAKLKSGVV